MFCGFDSFLVSLFKSYSFTYFLHILPYSHECSCFFNFMFLYYYFNFVKIFRNNYFIDFNSIFNFLHFHCYGFSSFCLKIIILLFQYFLRWYFNFYSLILFTFLENILLLLRYATHYSVIFPLTLRQSNAYPWSFPTVHVKLTHPVQNYTVGSFSL